MEENIVKKIEKKYRNIINDIVKKIYQNIKKKQRDYYQRNGERIKVYRQENKEHRLEWGRVYRQENKERISEHRKKYYKENKERISEHKKEYYKVEKHKEYRKKCRQRYYQRNREREKDKTMEWLRNNPEYRKEYQNNPRVKIKNNLRQRNRNKIDLKFNLNGRMSTAVNIALKNKKAGRCWETLVGYTLIDLIKRLNKTMPRDYTWKDFLIGELHIDHKIPISAFNFTRPEHIDFKKCWALSNLRLLPAKENLMKRNHLDKPFQPALRI